MNKRIIIIICFFAIIFISTVSFAGWLVYSKPAFRGKLVDDETKKPIEGAVVVAIYEKDVFGSPAGSNTYIIKIHESLTNETGEFDIPSYLTMTGPLSLEGEVDFIIYKPGYWTNRTRKGFRIYALRDGLAFRHTLPEKLRERVEGKWEIEFEEWKKKLPEKRKAIVRHGRRLRHYLPLLPMTGAKDRLKNLDIPFFTLTNDMDIEEINWISTSELSGHIMEISDYVVIGISKLNTWEERFKVRQISISDIPSDKWPILNQMIKKEEDWLKKNKSWRR